MQTWICKYDLGLVGNARGVFCDFERFSSFNCDCPRLFVGDFSQDFDRFSDWQMIFL